MCVCGSERQRARVCESVSVCGSFSFMIPTSRRDSYYEPILLLLSFELPSTVYVCMYICICACVDIYTYIYIDRETENSERESE